MESTNAKALKAGFWYVAASFAAKGLVFLSTPVISRLLSTEQYGVVSAYNSWLGFFTVIVTLDLYSCVEIARVDYADKKDEFLSSIVSLSNVAVIVFAGAAFFLQQLDLDFFKLPKGLTEFMFLEIFFRNILTLFQTHCRAYLQYKVNTALSLVTSVISTTLAIILTAYSNMNKIWADIIGSAIPVVAISGVLLWYILKKGKRFYNKIYWQYGLAISLPLIPHHLAGNVLNHFDRIIINGISGSISTAMYGMAGTYAAIAQVLWSSFNGAWCPWFYVKMAENNDEALGEIKNYAKPYLKTFMMICIGLIAIAPEAIRLFGSDKYVGCEWAAFPYVMGIYCQFVYSLYVNIEFYYKKTRVIAVGTIISAVMNVLLNLLCIPKWGYIAAAYTTFASYIMLFFVHYLVAKRIDGRDLYNDKMVFWQLGLFVMFSAIFAFLYRTTIIRYIFLAVICIGFLVINKRIIKTVVKKIVSK